MTVCGEKVTGVCVAGKCPYFKRCHPVVWDKYGKIATKTNEEWLQTADTEQLAEWLVEHIDCVNCYCKKDLCSGNHDSCKLTFVNWLKQPHQGENEK